MNAGGKVTIHNSIVAENSGSGWHNINGYEAVESGSSYNLIGNYGTGGISNGTDGNIVLGAGVSAGLAPLGDYGGPTWTHALVNDSPAIDHGSDVLALDINDDPLELDQRGLARIVDDPDMTDGSGGTVDIGAFEWYKPLLQVDTLRDENDGHYGPGDLSLREAICLASLIDGDDTITFAPGLFTSGARTLTLKYDGADSGKVPDQLLIDSDVMIVGPGDDLLTISGADVTRVFQVDSGTTVSICGLAIIDGNAGTADGGAIYSLGDLTLDDVRIANNTARFGGGIFTGGLGSSLTVDASSVVDNTSTDDQGGGIYVSDGDVVITFTTIDGNTGFEGGGVHLYDADLFELCNTTVSRNSGSGIYVDAAFTGRQRVENSTISNNDAEGLYIESADNSTEIKVLNTTIAANDGRGIRVDSGTTGVILQNSIVAENAGGSDVYGTFDGSSSGYNVIGAIDGSAGLSSDPNSYTGTILSPFDARITPLGMFGGTTETHALMYDSMALDAANMSTAPSADQRDAAHIDFAGMGGSGQMADIGSFGAANPLTAEGDIEVTYKYDRYLDAPSLEDGLSLREALREALEKQGPNTIVFDSEVFGSATTIQLLDAEGYGPLQLMSDVTIVGPGSNLLTIDANGVENVFTFANGDDEIDVSIQGSTLTGASSHAVLGYYVTADLNMDDVTIAGNDGNGVSFLNGNGTSSVTVTDSRIVDNSRLGMYVQGNVAVSVTNSEVSRSAMEGVIGEDVASLTVVDSTFLENGGEAAIYAFDVFGPTLISGTEIARNGGAGIKVEFSGLATRNVSIALRQPPWEFSVARLL